MPLQQAGTQSAPTLVSANNTTTVGATTLAMSGLVNGNLLVCLMFSLMTGPPGITLTGGNIMEYWGALGIGSETVHIYTKVIVAGDHSGGNTTLSMTNGGVNWTGNSRRMWAGTYNHSRGWGTAAQRHFGAAQEATVGVSPHASGNVAALGERPGMGFQVGYANTAWGGTLTIDGATPGFTAGTTNLVLSAPTYTAPRASVEAATFAGWTGSGPSHIHGILIVATKPPLPNSGRGRGASKTFARPIVTRPAGGRARTVSKGMGILNIGVLSCHARGRDTTKATGQVQMVFPMSGRGNTGGVGIALNEIPAMMRFSGRGRTASRAKAHPVKEASARARTVAKAGGRGTLIRRASGRANTVTKAKNIELTLAPSADASKAKGVGHVQVHVGQGRARTVTESGSRSIKTSIRSGRGRIYGRAIGVGRMVTVHTPSRARTITKAKGQGHLRVINRASGRANTTTKARAEGQHLLVFRISSISNTVTEAIGRGKKIFGKGKVSLGYRTGSIAIRTGRTGSIKQDV
jgi:hypothetical protein